MLGARREHAIRLEAAARGEIVHERTDIAVAALEGDSVVSSRTPAARVEPGDESLRGRLLVPGRAVDLPGEEQPRDSLRLQRRVELSRLDEVVLDRVARPQNLGVLEAGQGVHQIRLDVAGRLIEKPFR